MFEKNYFLFLTNYCNIKLNSLRSQHMNIRGFRRKILDTMQNLGLSGTTLKMVEKRLEEDWLIFLVLCILSLIFMYSFYRYWKS